VRQDLREMAVIEENGGKGHTAPTSNELGKGQEEEDETHLLDMSGYFCGQTGAKASAKRVPGQLGGGGGGASRCGRPAYGTPQNTSTGSRRRDAGSTMMPRIAPRGRRLRVTDRYIAPLDK
jgi:hypothetical protein